jgi:hypothetical protein
MVMDRAVFVIESDNSHLPCLLNPEGVTIQRTAGVRMRALSSGPIVLDGSSHDPLLYTNGGRTELTLDLVFDISLVSGIAESTVPDAAPAPALEDVRDLTRPLMELAESGMRAGTEKPVTFARFIWGKAWNLRGLVLAIAERLECFTNAGVPQRSWLRMRFVVVPEDMEQTMEAKSPAMELPAMLDEEKKIDPEEVLGHFTLSEAVTSSGDRSSERLDEIAFAHYGNPALWRLIAAFNGIDDPLADLSGRLLQVPPASAARSEA